MNMKLNQLSLATRNALIYFVLFILGLGVSGYVLFSYSSKEILSLTEENLEHNGDLVSIQFESYLANLETDLNQLAYSPLLSRYVNQTNSANLDLLTEEYRSFLRSKAPYFQVRLISAQSGNELIRVERLQGSVYTADFTDLQNKKDRDYFIELKSIPADSIYYSKIDLNKEYDAISEPIIPTLRIAKLLKTDSLGGVMVIINVDLKKLFAELEESLPKDYEFRVVNQDGHYLIHPNVAHEFTFEYGLPPYYSEEFNQSLDSILHQHALYYSENALHKFTTLGYKRANYGLYAIISAKNDTIFASFYVWRAKVIWVSVGIALLFLLIAFVYLRKQVRELKTITHQLVLFTDRQTPHKLPIDRKDEIGELARGFEVMSNRVSESHALIENARKQAEQAFEEKNEFLENMSHEIRNPLQSILGTIQILEQNQVGAHQTPYINSLKFSANQLKSLVTDVLDYSKIKKDQIELSREWVNLDEFCTDLLKALNYQAISKGIELKYDAFQGIQNTMYLLDRTRFYQILNNLIMNALKFTPNGGRVTLLIREIPNHPNRFMFEINDNGAGISPENIKRILERSYASDYVTGTGLGLTIVQKLLQLFGSTLKVESIEGTQSSFFFEIDLETQSKKETAEKPQADCWVQEEQHPTVLVIEDDMVLQDWYAFLFKDLQTTILSRPKLLEVNEFYDLIISDLNFEGSHSTIHELEVQLKGALTKKGEFIFVTGEQIDVRSVSTPVWIKPIQKAEIWQVLNRVYTHLNYGKPNFGNFEKDYDNQKELVKRALLVLGNEWEKDQRTLAQAIANRDTEKFDQVKHKMITSVRRLDLVRFESLLMELSIQLPELSEVELGRAEQKIELILGIFIQEIRAY